MARVNTSNAFKRVLLVDQRGSLKFGAFGDLLVEKFICMALCCDIVDLKAGSS